MLGWWYSWSTEHNLVIQRQEVRGGQLTQRSPGHNPRASRQEILPYEALQHAALAGTLAAHHGDLGQVEAEADPGAGQDVLQLVDGVDHVLHPTVLSHGEDKLSGILHDN